MSKAYISTSFSILLSAGLFAQSLDFNHIKIDQFGYPTKANKIAVISHAISGFNSPDTYNPSPTFELRRKDDNLTLFTGTLEAWNGGQTHAQSGDKVWWFDFSSFIGNGDYYVFDPVNNIRSAYFRISDAVYDQVLNQSLRMFYYQRCGMSKEEKFGGKWHDVACHIGSGQDKNCTPVSDKYNLSAAKDLSGGWHDAGDYNKYTNFTLSPLHALLSAYEQNPTVFSDSTNIPESKNGVPDILDEIKWELDWLMKMQLDNGSVLMKVAVPDHEAGSPPSEDKTPRYYAPAAASATRTVCSIFAHAYLVYKNQMDLSMASFADSCLNRALKAWNWLELNPAISTYDNSGFGSVNPEMSEYDQKAVQTTAAVYLFAATGLAKFNDYFIHHCQDFHSLQWTYWYPFETVYQDAMLYYTKIPGKDNTTASNIKNNCIQSVSSNNESMPAYLNHIDAYLAYLKDDDYVWGSNMVKCEKATIYLNMLFYGLDTAGNTPNDKEAALGYVHYLHGVNAMGLVLLTNMSSFGAENSANEIYHGWFWDGTAYDNASSSLYGPAPGFMPGGVNKNFQPDASYSGPVLSPPMNQPVQKSYKDWNTSWPEDSWEITEPAIYYQAAYVKLLSKFVSSANVLGIQNLTSGISVKLYPNPANDHIFITSSDVNEVKIMDVSGRLMKEKKDKGISSVDVSDLMAGFYVIHLFRNRYNFSSGILIKR
jgi:endoglucanase